jgi:hypothetical protein
LITLLDDPDPAVVRNTAMALTGRMPPALGGTLGTLGGFGPNRDVAAAWRTEFAHDLRMQARKLIKSPEEWVARAGAFMLASIGEPEDIPDLCAALDSAIGTRGLADELTRATEGIIGRGFNPPVPSDRAGDQIIWLVGLGRGARPAGWEATLARMLESPSYVQQMATKRLPKPAPDSLVPAVGRLLAQSEPEVLADACSIVQRDALRGLRPQALNVFRSTKNRAVFRNCGYAVLQLGPRMEYYDVVLARLTDAEIGAEALHALLNVFEGTTGGGGRTTIPAAEARRLSQRWRTFLDRHRADLESGRQLSLDSPDATADLVPEGWTLSRNGKPQWP